MNRAFRAPRLEPVSNKDRCERRLRAWLRSLIESKPVQYTIQELLDLANWQRGIVPTQPHPTSWHASKNLGGGTPLEEQITSTRNDAPAVVKHCLAIYEQDTLLELPALVGVTPRQATTTDPLRVIPAMRDDAPAPDHVPILTYRSPLTIWSACVIDAMDRFRAKYPGWEIGCIHMHPFNHMLLEASARPGAPYIGIPMQKNSKLTIEQVMIFGAPK